MNNFSDFFYFFCRGSVFSCCKDKLKDSWVRMVCFVLAGTISYIYFVGPIFGFLINVDVFHLGWYIHFSIVERSVWIVWILIKNLLFRCIENQYKNNESMTKVLQRVLLEVSIQWRYQCQFGRKTWLETSKMKWYGRYSKATICRLSVKNMWSGSW